MNKNFKDLIDNALPETSPTYDKDDNFKGFRMNQPSTLSVDINTPIVTNEELNTLPSQSRSALERDLTTTNSPALVNSSKQNTTTWKHMIVNSNVLARAGMSIDSSGNFEGFPFFSGFDTSIPTTWLGENAELPEHSAITAKFPYEVHSVGSFTQLSRRINKLAPQLLPQVKIAQANAIKEAVELALINGDSSVNPDQPDGLVKLISENKLSGLTENSSVKTGLTIIVECFEVLESNGIDKDEISIIVSPDVAKKFRLESNELYKAFPSLLSRLLVSKHMPTGKLVAGRYSDYQAVTSSSIEFLAHTYTPEGQPETGATRVRSIFDVDSTLLNQKSFVLVNGIS